MLKQVMSEGWQLYQKSFKAVLPLLCFSAGLVLVSDKISSYVGDRSGFTVNFIFAMTITLFTIYITTLTLIKLNDTDENQKLDLFQRANQKLIPIFISSIVYALFIVVGLILLVIPGIYWMTKKVLYDTAIIIDDKSHYSDAFKKSHELVKGDFWTVFWFLNIYLTPVSIVCILGVMESVLPTSSFKILATTGNLFLAFFWTPVFLCVKIRLYKKLTQQNIPLEIAHA